ncbi:MAG: ATP-dependent DNA helicase, partial [Bacteroidia bacterium]|nr:ATP-dependent DNA helicase [Bacteroidia bacterium]
MSPETILQKYWGYTSFRKNQKSIIQSIIDGHDTLALMATGGGKSICYQVPALMTDGVTLVISPLIALMKDQVERLKERGIFAEAIYSGMHPSAVDRILDNAIYGKIKLLYLSPERLKSEMAIARIQRMKVNLIAVDEAHCISQWGFDFRPSYLEIKDIREWHPTSPILALTATATARVIEDIEDQLELRQAQIFKSSFARSNIALSTTQAESKEHLLAKLCSDHQITRIVYANTRKQTKIFSDHLKRLGLQSDFYHAGLSTKERLRKQKAWTEGKISTIVCTNAFGMGIDKADVRQVIHLHIPGTIESYFQEAGRAGRDGQDAEAVLLYYQRDIDKLSTSIELSFPPMTTLRKVYQSLANFLNLAIGSGKNESFDFDLTKFCQAYNLQVLEAYHSLNVLEKEGWLTLSEGYSRPSSLRFKIPGNQVYQYQINDSKGSELIAVLLRT